MAKAELVERMEKAELRESMENTELQERRLMKPLMVRTEKRQVPIDRAEKAVTPRECQDS
jgi:hypothetical protein